MLLNIFVNMKTVCLLRLLAFCEDVNKVLSLKIRSGCFVESFVCSDFKITLGASDRVFHC